MLSLNIARVAKNIRTSHPLARLAYIYNLLSLEITRVASNVRTSHCLARVASLMHVDK